MPLAFLFQAMSIFAFYMTCRARWIDFGSIQISETLKAPGLRAAHTILCLGWGDRAYTIRALRPCECPISLSCSRAQDQHS